MNTRFHIPYRLNTPKSLYILLWLAMCRVYSFRFLQEHFLRVGLFQLFRFSDFIELIVDEISETPQCFHIWCSEPKVWTFVITSRFSFENLAFSTSDSNFETWIWSPKLPWGRFFDHTEKIYDLKSVWIEVSLSGLTDPLSFPSLWVFCFPKSL